MSVTLFRARLRRASTRMHVLLRRLLLVALVAVFVVIVVVADAGANSL